MDLVMKLRVLPALAMAATLLFSCDFFTDGPENGGEEIVDVFSITPESVTVPAEGGEFEFSVVSCKKALTDEAGFADNFCYVMHNIEKFDSIPPQLSEDKFFVDLFNSAKIANFTAREKQLYKSDMLDEQSIAMHERFIRKKERDERSLEIAKTMLADGVDPAFIAKHTGISEDTIKSLK